MWTGDVQSGYPTQWALNPSTYQNLPNEQVDWASLAQQWIKMKETFPEPTPPVPPAPPPPSIQADIEAGEAPMDVSKDDVPHPPAPPSLTNSSQGPGDGSWDSWGNWQQQWGWGGGWGGPSESYNAPAAAPPPATFDYNHGAPIPDTFEQGQQGYWSEGPAPFVRNKPSSGDWRPERASNNRRHSGKVEEVLEPDTTAMFDAAKRKQLPAWIREGLEKMEREKQKKLERERQIKEREEELQRRKLEEEEALASGVPLKSKFDTDSEESEKEAEPEVAVKPRRSRFDSGSSPVHVKPLAPSYSPPPVKRKTREEMMQDVMQNVRYVLTDILMTVTNEEMRKIADEVLADFRAKAPASRLRQTPALTSLTGKLGLGIYDSDSQDSSEESDDEPASKQNGMDSDEELRERINRKKQEFARIERDIEQQMEHEERERERQTQTEEDVEEEERTERGKEMGQVEPKPALLGNRADVRAEEPKVNPELKYEPTKVQSYTPDRTYNKKDSSVDRSEDSDSSTKSSSTSRSSSSSRHKKKKSSKRKKEKKSSKKKRKRSRSRSSDRRKSHKKSSHSHRYERERSRTRSRSRSRGHDDYYRSHRHSHSSESSHKRRHHSYSRSPDHYRGKRSSHRSRD